MSNPANTLKQQPLRTRTQKLTGIALFAALAIILNFLIKIPAPYAPFLFYEVWEIPIVAVLLLFGVYVAVSVSLINTVVLLLVFPGALPTGPFYNLAAVLVTLAAVVAGHSLGRKFNLHLRYLMLITTVLAVVVRTVGMSLFNYLLLPLSPPIGFDYPVASVVAILPLIAFFNASVVMYSVPLGYAVVRGIVARFRFSPAFPLSQRTPRLAQKV